MISAAVSPAAVPPDGSSPEEQWQSPNSTRKSRPARACTARSSARLLAVSPAPERRPAVGGVVTRREKEEQQQTSRIITPLTQPPAPAQLPRWTLRSMWELASLLNFLNVFRPLLNIVAEFSAEELETALISPNSTLDNVHIPLLRAIPPVTRMALGRATWVTVLCRKLKDWWHWVADGDIPLVASHGAEVEIYKNLEPATRVLILKALCDIRVEQEDIRNYIDDSLKHGIQLSAFRKERIGGDSHGVSYWYEDDPVVGHRLYREIRNIEVKKTKGKALPALPNASYQWEMLASNLDEFQDVSDKLLDSKNRTEVSLAKKLKIDVLPEVDKIQKRKDRLLKKQHRQALLLDSFVTADGISSGRSLRDRKPVTYTFDDYDKSINEAIKITKKRPNSPDLIVKREPASKPESNGEPNGTAQVTPEVPQHVSYDVQSPNQTEYDETDDEFHTGPLDRSNRRRKRPQRYSDKEFVEAITDNEADFDSDDIVGEAVYDDEYLRSRKQKVSSSSEGDEEYRWEDNAEDEEEDEEEDSLSISEDSDEHPQYKKLRGCSRRRGTKLRSVDELQAGLRRSRRSTRPRINYKQYELSDTDMESEKADKSNESDAGSDAMSDLQLPSASHDSQDEEDDEEMNDVKVNQEQNVETISEAPQSQPVAKTDTPGQACAGPQKRRFLDLNELAPGTGFEDGPNTIMKNEDDNT